MTHEIHTYLHCKRCLGAWQSDAVEVGFTPQGILLNCRKHGPIAHFTPEQIAQRVAHGPACDACRSGKHR